MTLLCCLPVTLQAQSPAEAEIRKELQTLFEPTPQPRPLASETIRGLVRKHGRDTVADLAIQPLTAALKGKDHQARRDVAWALYELKDPRSVPALVDFLRVEPHGEPAAEQTLAAIGEPSVVPLVEAFRSEKTNRHFLEKAAKVFAELKDTRAVPPLVEQLASTDHNLPRLCAEALGKIGGTDAVDALITAVKSGKPVAKLSAVKALGPMKNPRAVPALIEALKDNNQFVRGEAAGALGEIGDPAAIDALVAALTDSKLNTEAAASAALSKMRGGASTVLLQRFREAPTAAQRQTLLRALTRIGDPALPSLIESLNDPDPETAEVALDSLYALCSPTVAAQAFSDDSKKRAREAILAHFEAGKADAVRFSQRMFILAAIPEARAVRLMLAALKHKEPGHEDAPWYVPQDAVLAADKAGAYAVDPLIEGLRDPNADVRAGAAAMLGRLPVKMFGPQPEVDAVVNRIAQALIKTATDSNELAAVRVHAVQSLGYKGDSRHTAALVALLKDKSTPRSVRRAAAQAFKSADRSLTATFPQIFADKSEDQFVRADVAMILVGLENKFQDPAIANALRTVRTDRSQPAIVRAAAKTTRESMERLKASANSVKAVSSAAQPVPHGKQVWPAIKIKNQFTLGQRTMITSEGKGTPQEAKAWYEKQFSDWKTLKDWNETPIISALAGEWKVWLKGDIACLLIVQAEKGEVAVSQVFDREEDLQDMLASAPEEQVQRAYCSRNLNALRSAKGQAQRKFKLSADAPHEPSQFLQFVPGGLDALTCPASGKYDPGTLRKEARCSVHGTLATIGRH